MTRRINSGLVAVVVVLSLVVAACSSGGSSGTPRTPDPDDGAAGDSSSTGGDEESEGSNGSSGDEADDGGGGEDTEASQMVFDRGTVGELTPWRPCDTMECSTLTVPLVHDGDDDRTINLALIRLPTTGPADSRVGSVLFNPGGPGGSGIEFLNGAASWVPGSLTDSFDLVSWDPRGVGDSLGIDCNPNALEDSLYVPDLDGRSDDEIEDLAADAAQAATQCRSEYGDLLDHVGTNDTVRDLDLIRQALGDEELTYVGFSYGTLIGQGYLSMFPDRVRAMVLDGVVAREPTDADEELNLRRFEEVFEQRIAQTCQAATDCVLGADLVEVFDDLLAQGRSALEEGREPDVEPAHLVRAAELAGAAKFAHVRFANAVEAARAGDSGPLEELWGFAVAVDDTGTPRLFNGAFEAIWCGSMATDETFAELVDYQDRITAVAPRFALTAGLPLVCMEWGIEGEAVPAVTDPIPPVLVVGTRWDPSTPWEFAERLAAELNGSALLTYEGDGHTAYLQGNPCIDLAVTNYLLDVELPVVDSCS
ncbi:MAG: alpha/beta hydrolase [Actinomycetia bacterium]|nr:alpha/beta hydrolase [Actinomycetes bacterium]